MSTILIIGASRGIGLEVAKRAARDGANIAIIALRGSAGSGAADADVVLDGAEAAD